MVGHTDSSLETRKLEFSFFVALDLQELKRSDVKKKSAMVVVAQSAVCKRKHPRRSGKILLLEKACYLATNLGKNSQCSQNKFFCNNNHVSQIIYFLPWAGFLCDDM
jgi:hypothetical protein